MDSLVKVSEMLYKMIATHRHLNEPSQPVNLSELIVESEVIYFEHLAEFSSRNR